jgi:hypothetical protein
VKGICTLERGSMREKEIRGEEEYSSEERRGEERR